MATSPPDSLFFTLPPERTRPFLARLESYRLRYQRRLSGWGHGVHASRVAGHGMEFREFRDYAQGDDVRNLDWKTSARFDRPYVRTFQQEQNRFVHFIIDASASMTLWASDRKLDFGRDLALALGYLALCSDDPTYFSVHPRSPEIQHRFECTSRARILGVRNFLASRPTGGRLDLGSAASGAVQESRGRSGTVIVISDFLYQEEDWREALRRLVGRGLQVAAIQVRGAGEGELSRFQEEIVQVRDSETGQTRRIAINSQTRRHYRQALEAHQRRLQAYCHASRIWYAEFAPPDTEAGAYLESFALSQLPGMGFLRGKV